MKKKFYHIQEFGEKELLVTILSTELTSVYWHDLKNHLLKSKYANRAVVFDFMYRNGLSNRFFCARIGQNATSLGRLSKCEGKEQQYERIADRYFAKNVHVLEGSVLTQSQKAVYVSKLVHCF